MRQILRESSIRRVVGGGWIKRIAEGGIRQIMRGGIRRLMEGGGITGTAGGEWIIGIVSKGGIRRIVQEGKITQNLRGGKI